MGFCFFCIEVHEEVGLEEELDDLDEEDDSHIELLKIRKLFHQFKATSLSDTILLLYVASESGYTDRVHIGKKKRIVSFKFFDSSPLFFLRLF